MTMTIALDTYDRVVSIDEVVSGLACSCRCVECQEPVIARKGTQRTHHFSHLSKKVPCEVQPESFLHRYAKRVVMEAGGLHLPPMPGHEPGSEDTSSWWDFISVYEEVWLGSFRPDLVAQLPDGVLLIEFACTSFVDEEKLARIARYGSRAVEVDLRGLQVSVSAAGLETLKRDILHRADIKHWVFPAETKAELSPTPSVEDIPPCCVPEVDPVSERSRLTIQGMWVDYRVLAYGSVAVRSVSYNPVIAALLKRLARQYGGHYVAKYRNWLFPAWAKTLLVEELVSLSDCSPSEERPTELPEHRLTLPSRP